MASNASCPQNDLRYPQKYRSCRRPTSRPGLAAKDAPAARGPALRAFAVAWLRAPSGSTVASAFAKLRRTSRSSLPLIERLRHHGGRRMPEPPPRGKPGPTAPAERGRGGWRGEDRERQTAPKNRQAKPPVRSRSVHEVQRVRLASYRTIRSVNILASWSPSFRPQQRGLLRRPKAEGGETHRSATAMEEEECKALAAPAPTQGVSWP